MPRKTKASRVEKDLVELTEDLKRVQADFINYKRRQEEDRAQLLDYAKTEVIKQLLPIFDNIDRALAHVPKDLKDHDWAKGVTQVAKQAESLLDEMGVQRIKAKGEEFDPHFHEAVGMEDGDGDHEMVVEELQPGYQLGDQVIRPSMVKVGKRSK